MAEKDVVITYETLFELLRIEKNREDLQKLDDNFFEDVREYLRDKTSTFESKESQSLLFEADEKEKAKLEIENIKKILKELYDRREKKIVFTALNKARTGVILINTANMLKSERMLFDSMSMVMSEFRKNILYKLACGEVPKVDNLPKSVISKLNCGFLNGTQGLEADGEGDLAAGNMAQGPVQQNDQDTMPADAAAVSGVSASTADDDETGGLHFRTSASEEPKELKTNQKSTETSDKVKKVRILASIGEIVGPDLQIYGPYEEGAVTDLPGDLAKVLLEKKQAEEILN